MIYIVATLKNGDMTSFILMDWSIMHLISKQVEPFPELKTNCQTTHSVFLINNQKGSLPSTLAIGCLNVKKKKYCQNMSI